MLLIATLAGLCWLDFHSRAPLVWLLPIALLLALAASSEFLHLVAGQAIRPLGAIVLAGNLLIVASNVVPIWLLDSTAYPTGRLAWPLMAMVLCTLAAFAGEMWRYEQPGKVTTNLATAVLALVYVGILMSFLVQLRAIPPNRTGMTLLLAVILISKFCDIGAYTVGRLMGRHKLAPRLSPGKTVEGGIGGLAFAALGAYLVLGVFAVHAWWQWLLFGLLIGAAGMLGDLAESLLKRDLKQKDSSVWVPGFGGVLDVLDSVLYAAPVGYLCWWVGLVGS